MKKMFTNNSLLWRRRSALFIITVIAANVYTTHGQSYLLTIGQNPHIYFDREVIGRSNENHSTPTSNNIHGALNKDQDEQNSTIILIKKTVDTSESDLSKSAMDVITIVWYVATFLALAAFFFLMACNAIRMRTARNRDAAQPPPTPSPSYSEFAPPSYESVVKLETISNIYAIPFPMEEEKDINNSSNNNNNNNNNDSMELATPNPNAMVTFYTLNDLEKLGCS